MLDMFQFYTNIKFALNNVSLIRNFLTFFITNWALNKTAFTRGFDKKLCVNGQVVGVKNVTVQQSCNNGNQLMLLHVT